MTNEVRRQDIKMKPLSIIVLVLMSLTSFPSWGLSSQFVCNPWLYADGGESDESFLIHFDGWTVNLRKQNYKLANQGGTSLIYIHDTGYPYVLFVHDGDRGFLPKDKIHSNNSFFLTEIEDPIPNKFVPLIKQTKCKRVD
jgi:hypothetical protein